MYSLRYTCYSASGSVCGVSQQPHRRMARGWACWKRVVDGARSMHLTACQTVGYSQRYAAVGTHCSASQRVHHPLKPLAHWHPGGQTANSPAGLEPKTSKHPRTPQPCSPKCQKHWNPGAKNCLNTGTLEPKTSRTLEPWRKNRSNPRTLDKLSITWLRYSADNVVDAFECSSLSVSTTSAVEYQRWRRLFCAGARCKATCYRYPPPPYISRDLPPVTDARASDSCYLVGDTLAQSTDECTERRTCGLVGCTSSTPTQRHCDRLPGRRR
jgi:hypothetical protein